MACRITPSGFCRFVEAGELCRIPCPRRLVHNMPAAPGPTSIHACDQEHERGAHAAAPPGGRSPRQVAPTCSIHQPAQTPGDLLTYSCVLEASDEPPTRTSMPHPGLVRRMQPTTETDGSRPPAGTLSAPGLCRVCVGAEAPFARTDKRQCPRIVISAWSDGGLENMASHRAKTEPLEPRPHRTSFDLHRETGLEQATWTVLGLHGFVLLCTANHRPLSNCAAPIFCRFRRGQSTSSGIQVENLHR